MTTQSDRWKRFERSSDAYMTITVIFLLVIIFPILTSGNPDLDSVLSAALVGAAVTLAMAASAAHRWVIHTSWIASLLVLIGALFTGTPDSLETLGVVTLAVLLLASPVLILRRISKHKKVTATTIWGAVAAYLAFGLAFSFLYAAIFKANPESFTNMTAGARLGETNYFSFVTQTTLGYGDIAPVDDLPRALVVFQTLIGQIYLVIVVARIVSLLGRPYEPLRRRQSDEG